MELSKELKSFVEKYVYLLDEPKVDLEAFFKNAVLERINFDELGQLLKELELDNRSQIPFLLCSELRYALDIYEKKNNGFNFCGDYPPALNIKGMTGSGKTSITKAWAKDNNITLIACDLSLPTDIIYEAEDSGIMMPKKVDDELSLAKQLLYSSLKKYKDTERTVFFLDDYHRATPVNIKAIDEVIAKHSITDPISGDKLELPHLLFTVAIETT